MIDINTTNADSIKRKNCAIQCKFPYSITVLQTCIGKQTSENDGNIKEKRIMKVLEISILLLSYRIKFYF